MFGVFTRKIPIGSTLFYVACFLGMGSSAEESEPPVIVTSTVSKLPVSDASTTSFDVDISNTNLQAMDMLRAIPGFAVSQSGQRGALGQIRVRGAEADHLKVLIDGIEANDPGSELNWGTVSTVGVNRVEVLNGPRSAVWGDQALAGVINLETLPTEDQSSVLIGGGTLGTTLVQLARERVDESSFNGLSIKYIQSDGENASFVGDENDGFEQLSANFIGGRTMHGWDVRLNGRTNETLSQYDSSGFDSDRHIEVTRHLLGLRAERTEGESFKPTVLLNHAINETGNYSNQEKTNSISGMRTHLTLSSTIPIGRISESLIAIESTRESFRQRGNSPFGDPNQNQDISAVALSAENVTELGSFGIHTSVRVDENSDFKNAFTWNATLSLNTGNTNWFWTSGLGVKNPSFIDRFGYFPDSFVGNPGLKPERAIQHQAGLNVNWQKRSIKVIIFGAELEDEINGFAYDPVANAFTARNIEESNTRRGYEFSGNLTFNRFFVNYSYSHVDSQENSEQEIRRPRNLASVSLDSDLTHSWKLHVGANYVDEQLDRDFSVFPARLVTLSNYVLVNAHLQRKFSNGLSVHLRGENVFDELHQDVYGIRNVGRTVMTLIGYEL